MLIFFLKHTGINRYLRIIFFVSILLSLLRAEDWGFFMHKKINGFAISDLPDSPIQIFLVKNQEYIVNWSTQPDERKRKMPDEAHRHFIDLEDFPVRNYRKDIPKNWNAAVQKFTLQKLEEFGTAPWAIRAVYDELVQVFKTYPKEQDRLTENAEKMIRLMADLGHYIADIHVPLHTTSNYNGQLSQQEGIHSLWESVLPELFYDSYLLHEKKSKDHKSLYIPNLEDLIWKIIFDSHHQLPELLAQEKLAQEEVGQKEVRAKKSVYKSEAKPKKVKIKYRQEFLEAYHKRLNKMIEKQAEKAAFYIAAIWYSAWIDGGSPTLEDLVFENTEEETQERE